MEGARVDSQESLTVVHDLNWKNVNNLLSTATQRQVWGGLDGETHLKLIDGEEVECSGIALFTLAFNRWDIGILRLLVKGFISA